MGFAANTYRLDTLFAPASYTSLKGSVQVGASTPSPLSWVVQAADVKAWFDATGGTPGERHAAVVGRLVSLLVGAMGEPFRPAAGSPLVREVDFDESTGRVRVTGTAGGSLVVGG